ncbi:MAG: sodium:proton antiporter [Rubrobacteraceae bacterium]
MSQVTLYALSGVGMVAICLYGLISYPHLIRKILAINILGSGVFLLLISFARRVPGPEPDPVPHAMVLTGIVVAVCATAFALALARRVYDATGSPYLPEDEEAPEEPG